MRKSILLPAIFITFIACSGEKEMEVPTEQAHAFVGTWKVAIAMEDGVDMTDWHGRILKIEQVEKDSGAFNFQETLDTSVWPANGSWALYGNDTTRLDRNDGIGMLVGFNGCQQLVSTFLIEVEGPALDCPEYPCIGDPAGNWTFTFSPLEKN
jgi:hypothetical protein